MRVVKWIGGLLAGLVLLFVIGLVALTYALDAGVLTPRIVAAVEAATGRPATLGRVSIGLGLTPRVIIQDATLANLPGGSRPDMARIRRAEASLAILPLLGGEIAFRQVAIDGADILLEQPGGAPNWVFQPVPRDAASAPAPTAPPQAARQERRLTIGAITLANSRVTLPDPRLGTVEVQAARVQGVGSGGAESFTARFLLHGVTLSLIGEVPPAPAPIRATLSTGGNRLTVLGRPGGEVSFEATLPEYAALRPLLVTLAPQAPLPAVLPPLNGTLRLGADLLPLAATLQAGAADLAALRPGLRLTRLDIVAPAADRPAELTIAASQGDLPLAATLTLDRPGALLPWAPEAPLGFRLRASAGSAEAEASGRIERPRTLEAATAELRVTVPEMQALAPLLPDPLPLREATVTARVIADGPLRGPLRIEALHITSDALAAEGEMRLTPGSPSDIEGRLLAERIDVDALTRRAPRAAPTAPPSPSPAATPASPPAVAPAAPPVEAPASPPAATPAPSPAAGTARRVIPDIALPLDSLAAWQGRVELRAVEARIGGAHWRDVQAVIAQDAQVLHVAPFALASPGGTLRGEARIDRNPTPPAVALTLRSEGRGLDLGALRRARGEDVGIEGYAQVAIEASARGATTRALAASLSGEAGLALVDGRIDPAGMQRLGPELLALLMPNAPRDGVALRCLALRITADNGIATTSALLAETSVGRVTGRAVVNLRNETLAARLLPNVQLFGVSVRAPVGIGGTLAAPRIGVDPGRAVAQVVGDTVANRLWQDPSMDWLRGQRDGQPSADCAEQLRLARMGAEGPAPPPPSEAAPGPRDLPGPAQDLLRGLFGGRPR